MVIEHFMKGKDGKLLLDKTNEKSSRKVLP